MKRFLLFIAAAVLTFGGCAAEHKTDAFQPRRGDSLTFTLTDDDFSASGRFVYDETGACTLRFEKPDTLAPYTFTLDGDAVGVLAGDVSDSMALRDLFDDSVVGAFFNGSRVFLFGDADYRKAKDGTYTSEALVQGVQTAARFASDGRLSFLQRGSLRAEFLAAAE